jgi:hypothetical protein
MKFYRFETDWDAHGNSPWDAVWPKDYDYESAHVLATHVRLSQIWKPYACTYQQRFKKPDIFKFIMHFACNDRVAALLKPFFNSVELLPLDVQSEDRLFFIHHLVALDLAKDAETNACNPGDNITKIEKYTFDPLDIEPKCHIFGIRNPPGSDARNAGLSTRDLICSQKVVNVLTKHNITGVRFDFVWEG